MTLYLAMCNRSTFPQAENVIDRRRRQHLIQNLMRTTDAWSGLLWWALNGGVGRGRGGGNCSLGLLHSVGSFGYRDTNVSQVSVSEH